MTTEEIQKIINKQRRYFNSGATLPLKNRRLALTKLKELILKYEKEINLAVEADLGKSAFETYMCETGLVLSEITYMLKHLNAFAKEKTVWTPLAQFASRSFTKPSPHGVVLIMSPWNYPFLLTIEPLVDAIAAGNTAVVKPSAYSPKTGDIMKKLLEECFDPEFVSVVTGGRAENTSLLNQHFDYIFFTGSQAVGKEVMRHAADYLTPVTLELGGKSPCIVTETANLKLAAKRIVFGKYLNCGQTCVAPDYVYCDEKIHDQLIKEIVKQIPAQYGKEPLAREEYGSIVNKKHFDRLSGLMDSEKIICGGETKEQTLQIAPTVMDGVTFDDPIMQQEIFGPILPVLTYRTETEAIKKLQSLPHPLALYVFTDNKKTARNFTTRIGFGGGCINDTIIHLATSEMPFGGFGESGMGCYHGKEGFCTFSHYKSIVDKKTWIDLPMRYHPYRKINDMLIHIFLR